MQYDEFNEWEFLPLSLSPKEVKDPMEVIYNFFDDDALPGHLKTLHDWYFSLVADDYYRDRKGSPAGLLCFHKLTLKLVEAVHLLKDIPNKPPVTVSKEHLRHEQHEWSYYPLNLSQEEQLNPYLLFDKCFATYKLPQYRHQLYEWLEYGLSSKAAREFIEPEDMLRVNENLQELFSASWFIFQRTIDKPRLKTLAIEQSAGSITTIHSRPESKVTELYKLDRNLDEERSSLIRKIVSVAVHKVRSVQGMIYLGAAPSGKLFFLVLTDSDEQRQAQGLATTIEESCRDFAVVVALVHHASVLFTGLRNGNLFFNTVLSRPVVYLSGDLILPAAVPFFSLRASEDVFNWEHWYGQGQEFLKGAGYYLENCCYNAALFCLHQGAECMLIALIRGVVGYRINNHNLSRLLAIAQMFTGDISKVFDTTNADCQTLFDELKHAYVNVRYKDGYLAKGEDVAGLIVIVNELAAVVENVYQQHVFSNTL